MPRRPLVRALPRWLDGGASADALPELPLALVHFLTARGDLLAMEAALCLAFWLSVRDGAADVSATDVGALYSRCRRPAALPVVRSATESLRAAANAGLLDVVDGPRYRLTELGRAVVLALPDREAVGALRGLHKAARRPHALPRGSWERFG